MLRRDVPEVLQIEESLRSESWDETRLLEVTKQRDLISLVIEHGDKVVGYVVYRLRKYHFDLLRLAVHPGFRRCGIGSGLIEHLITKLSEHRRTRIRVEVPEDQLDVLLFLRSRQFLAEGVIRRLFGEDDGIIMYHRLDVDDPTMVDEPLDAESRDDKPHEDF